ncbi:MAG: 1,4-alpha-glucan branching protein GlgB [Opitutales bacterium]|nr:1,4-alpha-glucan branching protein GlgB [Opitutales bacterium]
MIISEKDLSAVLKSKHHSPHSVLGMHTITVKGNKCLVVRAYLDDAKSCEVVDYLGQPEKRYVLDRLSEDGFFEGLIPDREEPFAYRLRKESFAGGVSQFHDPYCFLPSLSNEDLYLFNEGNDYRAYLKLGAHCRTYGDVTGYSFAVWAPSAKRVSVVGDFNRWDGRYHVMRALGASGVWEIFIPGIFEGTKYKFEILTQEGHLVLKTDPYATAFESPPNNASIIKHVDSYDWQDAEWIENRARKDWQKEPVSVYEVHINSWKRVVEDGFRPYSYRELATELVAYVKDMGFTHVEFMPLAEHPFTGSWGYQVTGFFAPTHRYGSPEDFQFLVDTLHRNGIGVIMDWVPGHFPLDSFALAHFDGSHLYEHADPRQGFHQDWGTYIFNYGRHEVSCFLIANALSWIDRYHIDGLRVDAVASMLYLDYSRKDGEWIPNKFGGNENLDAIEFLRKTNRLVHELYPGVMTIAEESTAFGGVTKPVSENGLGFDFKWNMGWMHDTLEYFQKDPIHRKWHHNNLTFGMVYQYSENFIQVFSHDEVVHGKQSMIHKMAAGSMSDKASNLRALYALMWIWPGKNTLFMGSEFGQSNEWQYDASLQWELLQYLDHSGVQHLVRDLNGIYTSSPSLYTMDADGQGFSWVNLNDSEASILSFLRKGKADTDLWLAVGHYTPVVRSSYRVGVPRAGFWKEVINTDSKFYGGQGHGNFGGLYAEEVPCDGHPFSLELTIPPTSTLVFKYEG